MPFCHRQGCAQTPPSFSPSLLAGQLCVTRSHPGQPRPYTGVVNITSGEVAEDLATYLAESEQTNSALALGVCIDRQLQVKSAGGYLVQVRQSPAVLLVYQSTC